jgi:hypothetical protein
MTRDHFSKQMSNPYFQTKHYEEESVGTELEKSIEKKISKLIKKIWKSKNV